MHLVTKGAKAPSNARSTCIWNGVFHQKQKNRLPRTDCGRPTTYAGMVGISHVDGLCGRLLLCAKDPINCAQQMNELHWNLFGQFGTLQCSSDCKNRAVENTRKVAIHGPDQDGQNDLILNASQTITKFIDDDLKTMCGKVVLGQQVRISTAKRLSAEQTIGVVN